MEHQTSSAADALHAALSGSQTMSRIFDAPLPPPESMEGAFAFSLEDIAAGRTRTTNLHQGAPMPEPITSAVAAAGGLLAKLLPAGLGALLMVVVDPPATRRELFMRLFVSFAFSLLFGRFIFDLLHGLSLFAFLNWNADEHRTAVLGLCGAMGWSVVGGSSTWLKRFRADPTAAAADVKRAAS